MSPRRLLISAASIALLMVAARHVDWRAAAMVLSRASLVPLVAAIACNFVSVVLRGIRWWIFLRQIGARSLGLAVQGAIVGAGLNNVLLANGGEAARVVLVSRAAGVSRTAVVATLALDRLFDVVCFVILFCLAAFAMRLPEPLASSRWIAVGALAAIAVVLVILLRRTGRSHPSGTTRVARYAETLRSRVLELSTPARFTAAFCSSVGTWALQIVTFALAARAVGVRLPLAGTLSAMLLADTGLVLRATPGNVGFFQFAYALAARPFGVTSDAAIAAAFLLQLVQMVPLTLAALALGPTMFDRPAAAPLQPTVA